MRLSVLTFLILFLFTASFFAQQPGATPPVANDDTIKISTTLIQVDVTVTDKNGKIVTDLKPEDFEIYENGKKQTVTNFSFISVNKPIDRENSPTVKPGKNSIPIPPVKLKAEQVRRTYALVVDDLGLNFANIFWVRQSLRKFVNEQIQEGDLVAIIRTGNGIGALQSFTSDKRQLIAAIDKIKWNPQGRSGVSTFSPITTTLKDDLNGTVKSDGSVKNAQGAEEEKEFQNRIDEFRNENFAVGTLGALNYIIHGMREMPGRKAIMLFSEGFVLTSGKQPNRVFDAMRILADMANRSSVVIYTLDPRGLQIPGMANADDNIRQVLPGNFDPGSNYEDARTRRDTDFRDSQQSLRYLAHQTGGFPFVNQNDLDRGLQAAVEDQSSYYLLGYQPDENIFDPKKAKFNKLEVKILRPGLKIRYRSGFFGITDEKIRNVAQTPQQKIIAALISPFDSNGINLSLYPVFQNNEKTGDTVEALVYIDAKDLQFSESGGNRKANFDLIAMTFGENGIPVDRLFKNYSIEVNEKLYQNMMRNGFVYSLSVPIKKPGAYQFRIALRDTVSDRVGSASQFIEVPNIKKRMVLSNLVLDNFTAEEWRKIRLGGNRDDSEKSVFLDTTLRQFKRGTILQFDYVIYNPKQNQRIETQLRLIKDGRVVYDESPIAVKTEGQADPQRLQAAGAVSLGSDLEIGNYVLQVIVMESSKATNFATQFVEFEIIE